MPSEEKRGCAKQMLRSPRKPESALPAQRFKNAYECYGFEYGTRAVYIIGIGQHCEDRVHALAIDIRV